MPGGNTARREVVEHFGAVAVVALDDDGNVALVYQYRHPLGRRLWELPAGLLDLGREPPHITAAAELKEEAGLAAATWHTLIDLDSAPGFSDESVPVYLATGLSDVGRPEAHDEEADLTMRWFPLEEAVPDGFRQIANSLAVGGISPRTPSPMQLRCGPSTRIDRSPDVIRTADGALMTTFRQRSTTSCRATSTTCPSNAGSLPTR